MPGTDETRQCSEESNYKKQSALWAFLAMAITVRQPVVASDRNAAPSSSSQAPERCAGITDARDWRNPYIVVNTGGVLLILYGSSRPTNEMPVSQLAAYLSQLPKRAWPCGKVVAASKNGLSGGPNDGPAINDNCSRVNKILKEIGVKVEWWPSA